MLHGFDLSANVSHLLRRAHFRAEEIYSSQVGHDGLTPRQKALLIASYRLPGLYQSELAKQIAIDRNSLAEMLARLVKSGFLRRRKAAEDGRAHQIFITRRGIAALKKVMPIDWIVEDAVIAPLSPELRPAFIKALHQMLDIEPSRTSR